MESLESGTQPVAFALAGPVVMMRGRSSTYLMLVLCLMILVSGISPSRRRHVAADGSVREFDPDTHTWNLLPLEQSNDSVSAPAKLLLAIDGHRFPFNFASGEFQIEGVPIVVSGGDTRSSSKQVDGDTGRTVWDAAVVLAKYLEHKYGHGRRSLERRRVLELGAGTGLAGLAAAALGASVILSDLDYCLPALKANVLATTIEPPGQVSVLELDWLRPNFDGPVDVCVGADIVWLPHLVAPLVKLLVMLLAANPDMQLLLAHQTRSEHTDAEFFALLSGRFVVQQLGKAALPEGYHDSRVKLLHATARRSQTEATHQVEL